MALETNEHAFTVLGKMKQTVNTKKTLGRVWFRYFQLYGMTDKLTTACTKIGWTHTDRENYAKEHYHLVNQFTANMVQPSRSIWIGKSAPNTSECGHIEEKTSKI